MFYFKLLVIMLASSISISLFAIDTEVKLNVKSCYAQTAGGINIEAVCSSDRSICKTDETCTVDGIEGAINDGLLEDSMKNGVKEPLPDLSLIPKRFIIRDRC